MKNIRIGAEFSIDDPYPYYAALRANEPVHFSDMWGGWCLARWQDAVELLKDRRLSSRRAEGFINLVPDDLREAMRPLSELSAAGMGFSDPPDHGRLRGLVSHAFALRNIDKLREDIQAIATDLVDSIPQHGTFDLIRTFAYPLPATVILKVIGIPAEDRDRVKHWSDEMTSLLAHGVPSKRSIELTTHGGQALSEYYRALIAQRRQQPADDLISDLVTVCDQDDAYTEDDIVAVLVPLAVAGHETTTNLIGNGMLALLRNPDQLTRLIEDPTLAPGAVEEMLRFDGPVQRTTRVATEDLEIGGCQVSRGELVVVLLGSVNRDAEQFPEPDRFDITRGARHLAFSHGIHTCLGASLARLEGQIAFTTILERFPELSMAEPSVEWADNIAFRGLKHLPLVP